MEDKNIRFMILRETLLQLQICCNLSPEEMKEIRIDMNESDWKQEAEDPDWWYYQHPVPRGTVTEPLFTGVSFSGSGMDNSYQNSTIEIRVAAQAVQTAHNGASAMTAKGWPEE